jgi:hypothetical protein
MGRLGFRIRWTLRSDGLGQGRNVRNNRLDRIRLNGNRLSGNSLGKVGLGMDDPGVNRSRVVIFHVNRLVERYVAIAAVAATVAFLTQVVRAGVLGAADAYPRRLFLTDSANEWHG